MRMRGWLICLALLLPCVAAAQIPMPGKARLAGVVTDPAIDEVSGLAASRRHPGILWTHNDSGNLADLFAIDEQANRRARVRVSNAPNFDWEDMAAFHDAGQDWLLIADTGDNGGIRTELQLYFVPEPDLLEDSTTSAARVLRFVWPDGPRDCEAVAVDITERAIYLISKKRVPPELFRLSLDADSDAGPVTADRVGLVHHIRQPRLVDLRRNPVYGRYRAQVSGMDISTDGRRMAVLNYLGARIYVRAADEPWSDAVARPPIEARIPWLAQAEAIAFATDGDALWIGTEILPAPLLHIPLSTP